jgi:hypothetical protein
MHAAEPSGFYGNGHKHRRTDTDRVKDMDSNDTDTDTDIENFYCTNKLVLQNLMHLINSATESLAPNKWC